MPLANPMPTADGSTRPSNVVVPHAPKWHQWIIAAIIYGVVRSVAATIRFEWRDPNGVLIGRPERSQPVVFCIWHNRLALCLEVYRRYQTKAGRIDRMAAMVSASKDGGLLARVLEHWGVQPVRGSTSRRGRQALLELTTWAERGYDLAITPDGPRGPCYQVQDGVTSLAQLTGLAIAPITLNLTRKIRLRSWDRFQIPLPFSKCVVQLCPLVRVPREASDDERAAARRIIEEQLRAATID